MTSHLDSAFEFEAVLYYAIILPEAQTVPQLSTSWVLGNPDLIELVPRLNQ